MVRGQRGSNCGSGRAEEAGGGVRRETAGKRWGSPRGRGEGAVEAGVYLLTILPVYQSPAVDSLRQIVVAGKARFSTAACESNSKEGK